MGVEQFGGRARGVTRGRRGRWALGAGLATAVCGGMLGIVSEPATSAPAQAAAGGTASYVVLADDPGELDRVEAAVVANGGTVTSRNGAIGLLTVDAGPGFAAKVRHLADVAGVAVDRVIGRAPRLDDAELDVEAAAALPAGRGTGAPAVAPPGAEPLAGLQWDMAMIGATSTGSHAVSQGSPRVLVGIIDTGVDGQHPDLQPNFNAALSRNFVIDRLDLGDGPCELASCVDPVDADDGGHGTHVAGTIGAAINGIGIAGVAPRVALVNIRAGQDSGFFRLGPTVNALTYAGDAGIDVVNMSFFVDPWLFNCPNNPADAPEAQAEQRTVIKALDRALRYAGSRGVTLVGSLGNSHLNYDDVAAIVDTTSPNFPFQTTYPRAIQRNCLTLPVMGKDVIGVMALGPSKTKADYSNWGVTHGEVSAPGGWFRDGFGTPSYQTNENLVLSPYPRNVGLAAGRIDPTTGEPLHPMVVRDCSGATCAYYQWLQGTSMAAPHAAGVAALIVSRFGELDRRGFGLDPGRVAELLFSTATDTPCPSNPVIDYTAVGRDASYTAVCRGSAARNNIYGHGIVNALAAVHGVRGRT